METSPGSNSSWRPAAVARQIRLARRIAAALLVVFCIAALFATVQLPRVDGFVAATQSVYAVNDLITAALILAQFAIVRRWALFALAMGFLYTALIAMAHALVFPGAFAPAGLFGPGVQTPAWLYNFWKAGLPLAVIAYSLLKDDAGATARRNARRVASSSRASQL